MSICHYCDRAFRNELSLQQHFKNSFAHEWCDRCQQAFNSVTAKQQHLNNSMNHNRCNLCSSAAAATKVPPDFFSDRDLKDHLENFHHYCTACNTHHVSAAGLRSHDLAVHNMCSVCDSFFQTPDNLRAHRITHMPKEVECFGCDEKFVTSSAMVLHLESGYCRCQIDCNEIKQLAYECYQASHYITGFDDKPFRCEYCDRQFGLISALLQHLETNYCDGQATCDRPLGKFLNFLRLRI